MAGKLPRQRFSDQSLTRLDRVVREVEGRMTRQPDLPGIGEVPQIGERFVLRSPLTHGKPAVARRLIRIAEQGGKPEDYAWVQGSVDETIYGIGQDQNFYAEGSHVTCIMTPSGWCVVDGGAATALPPPDEMKDAGIDKVEPFMVFATSGFSEEYKWANQAILPRPGGLISDDTYIAHAFQALSGYCGQAFEPDNPPNATDATRKKSVVVPTVPLMGYSPFYGYGPYYNSNYDYDRYAPNSTTHPVRCAYKKFDGKMTNGEYAPAVIRDRFGTDLPPEGGQYWGPSRSGKLSRSFTALELFWWELRTNGDYTAKPQTVYVWMPEHPDHDEFVNSVYYQNWNGPPSTAYPGSGSDYWIRRINEEWPPVSLNFWVSDCNQVSSGVLASEPKPEPISRFFISPWGFWENPQWSTYGYQWYWLNYNYNSYWGAYYPGNVYGWFGPWGGWNYWGNNWGGLPPTAKDLPGVDSQPPEPPCGDLLQRYRYGFVLWEYGWRVIAGGTDEDEMTCMVDGPLRVNQSVIQENGTVPDKTPIDG